MYYNLSNNELREISKKSIESLEIWARRLINEKMVEKYGEDYIHYQLADGNYLIKKEIRLYVENMRKNEPTRYRRDIDTLLFDHILYFLCKQDLYNALFEDALKYAYPQGVNEVRIFLERLIPIRNALSHSNPISVHQAEQAICYSNDFISGLKEYYKEMGKEKVWNVPSIIKVSDSLGNVFDNLELEEGKVVPGSLIGIEQPLYCGDTYSIEIEIDSSFSSEEYTIKWSDNYVYVKEYDNKQKFIKEVAITDIGELHVIECYVTQNKEWHRYTTFDSRIIVHLTVLPPQ